VTQGARAVCLVTPPSAFLLDERVFVSLGILKVAAALESEGHPVSLLDLSGIENYLDPLVDHLADARPEIVGVTTTTPQLPAAVRIVETIRERSPNTRILLGGPHVTLTCAALKLEERRGIERGRARIAFERLSELVDVLCPGDGELSVLRAVGDDPPPVVDGDDPRAGYFMSDTQSTATPPHARHLVDMSSYHYKIEDRESTSLIAQLGCPFGCGFCGGRNSNSLRRIRTRTTDSIVEEVEHLHREYGYTGFMFYDDELNVSRTMVELMDRLAGLQDDLGVEFRLRGFVKSELFNDEQAAAMYRAGFRWLLCGFEAADPRILTNIRKRAGLDDNTRAVETAKRHGLKVKALMSVGHPGETAESVLAARDWLVRSEVDDFDCTVITTYPGTPYYDEAMPHEHLKDVYTYVQPDTGDRLHAYDLDYTRTADYYKGDPEGGYKAFVFTDHVDGKQLVELRDQLERHVREKLGIPFNAANSAMRYEHSMGQGLPGFILRQSGSAAPGA